MGRRACDEALLVPQEARPRGNYGELCTPPARYAILSPQDPLYHRGYIFGGLLHSIL
jgi:hypothetical protein